MITSINAESIWLNLPPLHDNNSQETKDREKFFILYKNVYTKTKTSIANNVLNYEILNVFLKVQE